MKPCSPTTAAVATLTGDRVLVYENRSAGAGGQRRGTERVVARLADLGFAVTRLDNPPALVEAAADARRAERLRCVVVAGGDGTFNRVLNAVPDSVPLALCPTGTENLLAGYLRHTRRPEDVARLVRDGVVVPLDAGVADGRLFALMASVGIDADVVHRVHERRTAGGATRNISHLAYAQPILESLGGYGRPTIRVSVDGVGGAAPRVIEGTWLFAVNVPRYASGLRITPRADATDGLLDLCCFRRGDFAADLWYLWHIARRRHHRLRSVELLGAARCRVASLGETPAPLQVDGDPGGRTPLELSSAPGRMRVAVSRSTARRLLGNETPIAEPRTCPNLSPPPATTSPSSPK